MHTVKDYMSLAWQELAEKMEVYDKLDVAACNYLNVAALYGFDSKPALDTLYRGVRNAFMLGVFYAREQEREEREMWS